MIDLDWFSQENLEQIQKILKVAIKQADILQKEQELFSPILIPLEALEKEGISRRNVDLLFDKIREFEGEDSVLFGTAWTTEDKKTYLLFSPKALGEIRKLKKAVEEKLTENNPEGDRKILAKQLNKSFENDRQNIEISRAWFEAIANSTKPALEAYQTYVAQTLINLEPFKRTIEENARVINELSKTVIMPNLEAVKPMLREIETSLNRTKKIYDNQKLVMSSPLPPRISEAVQRNDLVKEIRTLSDRVEELTKKQDGGSGFPKKLTMRKSRNSDIVRPEFPPDLKWEEVTIQFFNPQEVLVKARGKVLNTNFEGMGFMNEKTNLPNKQWELLARLSQRNGEMSWQNNKDLSKKDIDATKKRKQLLSDMLKDFFQISNDPFSEYSKVKMYKIKINLIPESGQAENDDDALGIKAYLKEAAPEIDDQV